MNIARKSKSNEEIRPCPFELYSNRIPNWIIIEFKNLIQTVKEWKDSLFFYLISFFYISKLKNREQPSH